MVVLLATILFVVTSGADHSLFSSGIGNQHFHAVTISPAVVIGTITNMKE